MRTISENNKFERLLEQCLRADDRAWARLSLDSDLMSRHIKEEDKSEVIDQSIACGHNWGQTIRKKYPERKTIDILRELGIGYIQESYDRPETKQIIFFAQFKENKIFVSQDRVDEIEEMIAEYGLHKILGMFDTADVLAAHELFHYIESQNPDIITRNFKIRGCGLFRKKGRPYMASEIGAFSFAQELCEISFHPKVLEVVALYKKARTISDKIVADVCRYIVENK